MGLHDTRVVVCATYHGTSWDLAKGTGTVDGKSGHVWFLLAGRHGTSPAICVTTKATKKIQTAMFIQRIHRKIDLEV